MLQIYETKDFKKLAICMVYKDSLNLTCTMQKAAKVGNDILCYNEFRFFFAFSQCLKFRMVCQNFSLFIVESEISVTEENLCTIPGK